jgi:hypothetical protein
MRGLTVRTAAGVAIVSFVLLIGAASVSGAATPVSVTGQASCNSGTGNYTINWIITNGEQVNFQPIGVTITSAVESGARTATLTSGVKPNPIPASGNATASDGPFANTSGTVTLSIAWSNSTFEVSGTATGSVDLDGLCFPPSTTTSAAPTTTASPTTTSAAPTTTAASTTTVAVEAVTAAPSFTG